MLSPRLIEELTKEMSLKRLWHTGLFVTWSINHDDVDAEIKLHRAVLDRALIDQFHPNKKIKRDVEKWLDLSNPDFLEACERADLDHKLVYQVFTEINKILQGVNEFPTHFQ